MSAWYDVFAAGERRLVESGLAALDARPGDAVLEIGAGTGRALCALATAVGDSGRVTGLDISDGMLRVARRKLEKCGLAARVKLDRGDAASLPYPDGSFDAVFMSFTLELFDSADIQIALGECSRVLKENGRLCLVSMSSRGEPGTMTRLYLRAHRRFPRYVDCRPIDAAGSLAGAGFDVMESGVGSMFGLPVEIVLASRRSDKTVQSDERSMRKRLIDRGGNPNMTDGFGEAVQGKKKATKIKGISRNMDLFLRGFFRLPLLDRWHPWFMADKTDMRWLPINQDIEMPENTPMPLTLLDRLIEEASHRVIIDYCGCRKGVSCKHYPVEVGCLLMGDSALENKRFPFREVGPDEAKAHARKAVDAGLVPIVGKARVDNAIFQIKDRHRLLTVCFCCECCCVTRVATYAPLKYLEPTFPRLESISLTVTDDCKGCGKCVKHCYVNTIELVDGRAVINGQCRACGRCATVCPNDAIKMRISDPEFLEKTYDRIRSYVKYD
jgi:UDP-glucose 4-epimerase